MAKTLSTNFNPLLLFWTGVRAMDHCWCSCMRCLAGPPALRPQEKVVNKQFQDAITLEHLTCCTPSTEGRSWQWSSSKMWAHGLLAVTLASSQASPSQGCSLPWQLLLHKSDQHLPTHLVARCCSLWCWSSLCWPGKKTDNITSIFSINWEGIQHMQFHTQQDQELAVCSKSKQACLLLPHAAWNQGLALVNYETFC